MRPLIKPQKPQMSEDMKRFWESRERAKKVEKIQEKQVFHLSEKEAMRCRYTIVNQSERMAECTIHIADSFSHGIRMFPPIDWDLKDGIPYYKGERWFANIKENTERFIEDEETA